MDVTGVSKSGSASACAGTNPFSFLVLNGLGVEQDEQKAFELYQQAAAQGCLPALNSLGYLYVQGIGTDEDAVKGFNVLVKAYQIKPTWNRETIVSRVQTRQWNKQYNLQYTAIPSTYKKPPILNGRFPVMRMGFIIIITMSVIFILWIWKRFRLLSSPRV